MNSVSHIEAVRIRAVLEDALEKLSFLSIVTPDVAGHNDEMAALVGDEISQTIKEQRALEAKYDELVKQAASLKGHANKAKLREVQAQLKAVSDTLRDSMRNLCRSLKDNPDVGDNLAKVAEERDALATLLDGAYTELLDGHYHTLAESVRVEHEARARVSAVAQAEESTTREVASLTDTLKEEEDKHTVEVESRKAEIAGLKDKLRKLKQDTTATIRYARKETSSKSEATGRLYSVEESALQTSIDAMKAKIAAEAEAHEASMEQLRKEQEELVKLGESWKSKHAEAVAKASEQVGALSKERDAQKAQLDAIQLRYEKDLQIMADKSAEAERVSLEKAQTRAREDGEKRAGAALAKVLGPMFMAILGARQLAEADKSKGKKK